MTARDVADARLMGADCVLLIAAALDDRRAASSSTSWPLELGLDVLVEVHDEPELERRSTPGPRSSASTSATSSTFEVDHEPRRADGGADPATASSRSPSRASATPTTPQRSRDAGYDAVLVGETLVTAADPRRGDRRALRLGVTPVSAGSLGHRRHRARRRPQPVPFASACS